MRDQVAVCRFCPNVSFDGLNFSDERDDGTVRCAACGELGDVYVPKGRVNRTLGEMKQSESAPSFMVTRWMAFLEGR